MAQDPTASPEEVRAFDLLLNGDESDDAEARRLMEALAEAGRPEAVNALATMVGNGIGGGEPDLERARQLTVQAADMGSIGANMSLADFYTDGANGFPRDPARGLAHARRAAEATSNPRSAAYAQWRLGMRLLDGANGPSDPVAAYAWVAQAAESGSVQGMVSRAVMLAIGQGVPRDAAAARQWYHRAAHSGELGSAHALRGLGGMLMTGEGGPEDRPLGYAYLVLALEGGDQTAAAVIQRMQHLIDDNVRAQAQPIITAWRLEHTAALPDRGEDGRLN